MRCHSMLHHGTSRALMPAHFDQEVGITLVINVEDIKGAGMTRESANAHMERL